VNIRSYAASVSRQNRSFANGDAGAKICADMQLSTEGVIFAMYHRCQWEDKMRLLLSLVLSLFVVSGMSVTASSQSSCLRPNTGSCVDFPNGGSHTGIDTNGNTATRQVERGDHICVATTSLGRPGVPFPLAQFTRDGAPWPTDSWAVRASDFCFDKR